MTGPINKPRSPSSTPTSPEPALAIAHLPEEEKEEQALAGESSASLVAEYSDKMLSIGASYGHIRVQQDNLKERIRIRKGDAGEKKIGKGPIAKIHPTGSSSTGRPFPAGEH